MISHHAALIYIMVIVAAVDRQMKDSELHLIGDRTKDLPIFAGYDRQKLIETSQECAVILNTKDGLDHVLSLAAQALPPHLRETAYLLACETSAIDRKVPYLESVLLERVRKALGVDRLAAAAMERATVARLAVL